MSDAHIPSSNISAENFRDLVNMMKIESDPVKRSALSKSLSESLLKPNGFNAYFDYLSSNTDDNIECMNLFCKIVLTRPSKFSNDTEYLLCSKTNFSDIIERFLRNNDEQSLQIFITKIFYFLRRNQNEGCFDFFFDALFLSSEEMGLLMFKKLCSWKFYVEELSESYPRQFKRILNAFLNTKSPQKVMSETLVSSSSIISSSALVLILSDLKCEQIKRFLSLWTDTEIPEQCIESSIVASFPEKDVIIFLMDKCEKISLNKKCKAILKEKSQSSKYDSTVWEQFFHNDDYVLDSKSKTETDHSNLPSYGEIYTNIESGTPTDIAFGMHCLRLKITQNPNMKIDSKLLNLVISCLFHEESFVYMNSIKTCICIGKTDAHNVCDALFKTLKSQINAENILIMLRFVEIFDCLLLYLKFDASLSPWTEVFSLHCAKFISSDCFEVKCSIINYYINIIIYDYSAFIKNQKEIWNSFNLSSKVPLHSDLETEVLFKFIDTYLNLIYTEGRNLSEDSILLELNDFLRKSVTSTSQSISTMAYQNILNLEKIRSFK